MKNGRFAGTFTHGAVRINKEKVMKKSVAVLFTIMTVACNSQSDKKGEIKTGTQGRALTSCADPGVGVIRDCLLPLLPPGPQGPAGPEGPQGVQGPAGVCPTPTCPAGMEEIRTESGSLVYCFEILPPPEVNWVACRTSCADRGAKLVSLTDLPLVCAADPGVFGETIEKYWLSDVDSTALLSSIYGNVQLFPPLQLGGVLVNSCTFINQYSSSDIPTSGEPYNSTVNLVRAERQYLSHDDVGSLRIQNDITIEAWIELESLPDSGQHYPIVSKAGSAATYAFSYSNFGEGRHLRFGVSHHTGTENLYVTYNIDLDTGRWYHLGANRNSISGAMKLFLDGVEVASVNNSSGAAMNNETTLPFNIGLFTYYGGSEHFSGRIDDIRLWNVVRSETEIAANRGIELAGNEIGLQGYWKLNNSLADSTTNANTLTMSGMPTFVYPGLVTSLLSFVTSQQSSRCMCGIEPRVR